MVEIFQKDSSSDDDEEPAEWTWVSMAEQASGDVEMKPAEPKDKGPIEELLPRFVPANENFLFLEIELKDVVLPRNVAPPPGITAPFWSTGCYFAAWIGPLGPLHVAKTPTVFTGPGGRPLFYSEFVLPINRRLKGAYFCLELVREEPRPMDPGTSTGERVLGRFRVKLVANRRLPWQANFEPKLYAHSPSPAYVGSVRVHMVLREPINRDRDRDRDRD